MLKHTNKQICLLSIPKKVSPKIREAVKKGAQSAGYKTISTNNSILRSRSLPEHIFAAIKSADCFIADISESNPNVFFELGVAQSMGKEILLIANELVFKEISPDFHQWQILIYKESEKTLSVLSNRIESSLEKIKFQQTNIFGSQMTSPFYVDWDNLNPRDAENLCKELLTQMGFRRPDWGKGSREIDLIAELPKQDPDGFEYKELWLISMGLHSPVEMLVDMASHDPEFFVHRLLKYSGRLEESLSHGYDSLTLLLILFRKGPHIDELEKLRDRIARRLSRKQPYGLNVRLRVWDQDYLTSLVHKFPNIGYKYFSDEGRIGSKTRKSIEELYAENSILTDRLASKNKELEDEKNKRIRAERDSVWKEISFSAAHNIGNPIFAIETDLDPLVKRISEQRKAEAMEVVDNICASVKKAKLFIEQFKSLAKAQEIKPSAIALRPLLEDACKLVCNQGVNCSIQCPPELEIYGDPERLAECFDELVMNATYWLDKAEKNIWIEVINPAPEPLPDFLDSSQQYILVHLKDNGCGIQITEKDKIFDAFFTKRKSGSGLGLALVRRIIDGHGGGIIEIGAYGIGANFEIFLPLNAKR